MTIKTELIRPPVIEKCAIMPKTTLDAIDCRIVAALQADVD